MSDFAGKVALVTGASRGIGRAVAERLAAGGSVVVLTKSLAQELAWRNIRVNAVTPGFVETDMTARLPEATRTAMLERIPLGRMASVKEVAEAVAFLAGERSSYITGAVLKVNGG